MHVAVILLLVINRPNGQPHSREAASVQIVPVAPTVRSEHAVAPLSDALIEPPLRRPAVTRPSFAITEPTAPPAPSAPLAVKGPCAPHRPDDPPDTPACPPVLNLPGGYHLDAMGRLAPNETTLPFEVETPEQIEAGHRAALTRLGKLFGPPPKKASAAGSRDRAPIGAQEPWQKMDQFQEEYLSETAPIWQRAEDELLGR